MLKAKTYLKPKTNNLSSDFITKADWSNNLCWKQSLRILKMSSFCRNVSEEGKETTGICLWAYSLKHTEVLLGKERL